MAETWTLHPQLERDTASIGDLPLSRVLIINDANYPWLLLVPRRPLVVPAVSRTVPFLPSFALHVFPPA